MHLRNGFNTKKVFAAMMASLAVALAYIAWFWYSLMFASPIELYHRTWQIARDNYFDKTALRDWLKYEHLYDNEIKTDEDAVRCANQMLASLGDPYTALHPKEELDKIAKLQSEKFVGIGVFLESVNSALGNKTFLAVKSLMPGGPAIKAGLKPGDTILSVNGEDGHGLTIEKLREIAGSQENKRTIVVVKRGDKKLSIALRPATVIRKDVELMDSDKEIAHIVIRNFTKKGTADSTMTILRRTAHRRGIVLDLRNNPGGSVDECLKLATAFVREGPLVTLKVRDLGRGHHYQTYSARNDCLELKRTSEDGSVIEVKRLERFEPIAGSRPLVVLINRNSASAAEMLAAALLDNKRAKLVGTKSFGKGVAQASLPIANGAVLSVTCVNYLTPSGKFLGTGRAILEPKSSEGLQPDVIVPDTKPDKFLPIDRQLSEAVRLLALN